MENGKRNCKCSSLGPVLPCRACLCACLPFLLCLQSTSTHTSLHWVLGYRQRVLWYIRTLRLPLALARAPCSLSSLSLGAFIPRRATRAYYPPRFASCSLFGGLGPPAGTHTQPFFSSCQYEPARVRDWSQGVTHLLLWFWSPVVFMFLGSGFWVLGSRFGVLPPAPP